MVVAVGKAVSFCEMGCETIIDTGTSTISVPRKDIEKINELIMADTSVFGRFKVQYCLKTLYTLVLTATVQLYSYMNYSVVFIILSVVSIFWMLERENKLSQSASYVWVFPYIHLSVYMFTPRRSFCHRLFFFFISHFLIFVLLMFVFSFRCICWMPVQTAFMNLFTSGLSICCQSYLYRIHYYFMVRAWLLYSFGKCICYVKIKMLLLSAF